MPSQPNASTDGVRSLSLPVAQAMRELADRLSALCSESDKGRIATLSADLKGIGWNSLFVSSSIDRYLQISWHEKRSTAGEFEKEYLHQLDSLLVAARYLEQSVKNLRALEFDTPDFSKANQDAYTCLAEKLGEIVRECQRSANQTNK